MVVVRCFWSHEGQYFCNNKTKLMFMFWTHDSISTPTSGAHTLGIQRGSDQRSQTYHNHSHNTLTHSPHQIAPHNHLSKVAAQNHTSSGPVPKAFLPHLLKVLQLWKEPLQIRSLALKRSPLLGPLSRCPLMREPLDSAH